MQHRTLTPSWPIRDSNPGCVRDLNQVVGLGEQQQDAPVPDPQPPLRHVGQLPQLSGGVRILADGLECLLDALADRRVKTPEISQRCAGQLDPPDRLGHPSSRS